MVSTTWPIAEEALLLKRYSVHGSKWCTDFLSRSPSAVRTRAHLLGIKLEKKNSTHKKLSADREREVLILYEDGLDTVALSKKFNVSRGVINRIIRESGIKRSVFREDQEYRIGLFKKQHPALCLEIWDEATLKMRGIIK